jgi:SAM-dependent methyltransferase
MSDPRPTDWFDLAFDELYADLYSHRDDCEARVLVHSLQEKFPLRGAVLDVACGAGRLLEPLRAAFGESVGIDRSAALLHRARARGSSSPLVRGDMRELPFRSGTFGSAVSLFTSFGYFDSVEQDRQALCEVGRTLAPSGRFVLDYLNPDTTIRHLIPSSVRRVGSVVVQERRWVDPSGPYLRKEVSVTGDEPVRYEERIRLYDAVGLQSLTSAARLRVEAFWGSYEGASYDRDHSPRLILLCEREDA